MSKRLGELDIGEETDYELSQRVPPTLSGYSRQGSRRRRVLEYDPFVLTPYTKQVHKGELLLPRSSHTPDSRKNL
jgi:hypothetical protein